MIAAFIALSPFIVLLCIGVGCFCYGLGKRQSKTVVIRPNQAQWDLSATVHQQIRTIARLKSALSLAEETAQDLRDKLNNKQPL